ncbi:lactate utilization protein C [Bacillaceae bacterium Marseille-Q3522]|nr:lactate utilization protein C [Bacillaceae bacterium Marseille-Q3522]
MTNQRIYNREAFLQKIAGRFAREVNLTGVKRPVWKYRPQEKVLKDAAQDDLLKILKKQCLDIHTDFYAAAKADLPEMLTQIIGKYGGGPIVAWKDERFSSYGLDPLFFEKNIFIWEANQGAINIEKANQAIIGIVISNVALAESGTVVLYSHINCGRTVAVLPEYLIVMIPYSSIVPRMTQAMKLIREKGKNQQQYPSSIHFITGPSNSADIEMNLVIGVHGPVKVAYIVMTDLSQIKGQ